jgi:predicted RNase H-like HicB family nuclease
MLFEYAQKAIEKAVYKRLDNGTWFAEIPGFPGVWANGRTVEACRKELWGVLEEWIILTPTAQCRHFFLGSSAGLT